MHLIFDSNQVNLLLYSKENNLPYVISLSRPTQGSRAMFYWRSDSSLPRIGMSL